MSTDAKLPNPINASSMGGGRDGGDPPSVNVTLKPADTQPAASQLLWVIIRNRTNALGFNRYKDYLDKVMCGGELPGGGRASAAVMAAFRTMDSYQLLKIATEAYLMQEIGVLDVDKTMKDLRDPSSPNRFDALEEQRRLGFPATLSDLEDMRRSYYADLLPEHHVLLPYFKLILSKLSDLPIKGKDEVHPNCYGVLRAQLTGPLALELIWSYWHEEGMLVQAVAAIAMRFQNRRISTGPAGARDPLAELEVSPLRPLNNIIWGYLQDEFHRLTVLRRAHEYDHHYGLTLYGKATVNFNPADSRSKFLEALHRLINTCITFYKQADDTTVIADGFPVLNALKEVHLILSEGAHNQFGDLPWTARVEMLIQQWLLARPEMREFLPGRTMVAYPEPWMNSVDAMKRLQGWTDTSVMHFRDLGVYGEQILLSVRYGAWSTVIDRTEASDWALYWRAEIMQYACAYRSVTGVDLAVTPVDATLPSTLLRQRLQQRSAR